MQGSDFVSDKLSSKGLAAGASILGLLADLSVKYVVKNSIQPGETVSVINGFFNLVHVHNTGVAFSLFGRVDPSIINPVLITINSAVLIFLIFLLFRKDPLIEPRLALGLITGGALGNLTDRIINGYVTDFLDIYVGRYHWPAFNLADVFITSGIVLFFIFTFLTIPRGKKS